MGNLGMPLLGLLAPLLPEDHFCICFSFYTELGALWNPGGRSLVHSTLVGLVISTKFATPDIGGGQVGKRKEKTAGKPGACFLPP